jgi:hypothetical protein
VQRLLDICAAALSSIAAGMRMPEIRSVQDEDEMTNAFMD